MFCYTTVSQVTMALVRLLVLFSIGIILALASDKPPPTPKPDRNRDQSVTYGKLGPNDTLVYSERIDIGFWMSFSPFLKFPQRNVSYPRPPATEGVNLTCIKVLDKLRGGQNAYFGITQGGVGSKNATVRFQTRKGYAIMYVVQFYGPLP